mmetsp:Transcript_25359/g.22406  ORF Transcript_25359/g.22406 Transcript_25359/m.22406 type:complete len:153 (+) Transcript_25359:96-554(+)
MQSVFYTNQSLILPKEGKYGELYLGNYLAAEDAKFHKMKGVTSILTVAKSPFLTIPDTISSQKVIDADDDPSFILSKYFKECFDYIHKERSKGRNVLVHCMAGVSRSATIVIGYIMTYYGKDMKTAFNMVLEKRRCIGPNYGFRSQLEVYEK